MIKKILKSKVPLIYVVIGLTLLWAFKEIIPIFLGAGHYFSNLNLEKKEKAEFNFVTGVVSIFFTAIVGYFAAEVRLRNDIRNEKKKVEDESIRVVRLIVIEAKSNIKALKTIHNDSFVVEDIDKIKSMYSEAILWKYIDKLTLSQEQTESLYKISVRLRVVLAMTDVSEFKTKITGLIPRYESIINDLEQNYL